MCVEWNTEQKHKSKETGLKRPADYRNYNSTIRSGHNVLLKHFVEDTTQQTKAK